MTALYAQVTQLLKAHSYCRLAPALRSHELWGNGTVAITVPNCCLSRHTANAVLKSAGIPQRL